MSERGARAQIAAAMMIVVALAALAEGWVNLAVWRIRALTHRAAPRPQYPTNPSDAVPTHPGERAL